jgi:TRAP-type mannitol/chloroaromatic compound transport system substrate-binding protein
MEQAMATPNLTITRTPAGVVTPGTQVTFTVTATDADARSISYSFKGTDSTGNEKIVSETVVVSDPVTVTATVSDPAGTASNAVKDGTNPAIWRATV